MRSSRVLADGAAACIEASDAKPPAVRPRARPPCFEGGNRDAALRRLLPPPLEPEP